MLRLKIKYLSTILVIFSSCVVLMACVDIRSDVTTATIAQTPFSELTPWPEPDSRGIINAKQGRFVETRQDETMFDIATRTGENANEISDLNDIDINTKLRAGKFLRLPPLEIPSDPQFTEDQNTDISTENDPSKSLQPRDSESAYKYNRHTVQPGETAFTIAEIYEISVRTLADWNQLGADFAVRSGQILIIPVNLPLRYDSDQQMEPATEEPEPEVITIAPQPVLAEDPFTVPIDGKVVSEYSGPNGNEGIDISANPGSSVYAISDGTVTLVSLMKDDVFVILVRHVNDVYSVYQNVTAATVDKGDRVSKGDKIGELATNADNLHLEIREGTQSVDPRKYLPKGSYTQ